MTRLGPLGQRELDAFRAGDAGLRGGVKFQIGRDLVRQFEHADVLHDECVDTGFRNGTENARGFGEFVFEDQRVERQTTPHASAVQRSHRFGQLAQLKADLSAGGEVLEAEVAGIRASFDRRVELRPMSGRTHHFGFLGIGMSFLT